MKKVFLPSSFALPAGNGYRTKSMRMLLLALLFCAGSYNGFANVSVTSGTGGTNICPTHAVGGGSTSFTTLGTITVSEGATNDLSSGANTLILTAPTGWQFNTSSLPTFGFSGGADITSVGGSYSAGSLVITITTSGTANFDQFTVTGLQVEATTTSAASGYVYASTSFIAGITTGSTGTDFGDVSLQSGTAPSVSIAVSPSSTICAGDGVTFTPTPTNGGTGPSYTWFVNGSSVGSGSTFSSSVLANGNAVDAVMTAGSGGCFFPLTATSNTITMTVGALPTTVSVSGGGTVCGSTTLTASNGGSGTIYFQGTTSGGTSTATPSSSQSISSSGTYYFRAQSAAGCWGPQGSATVTVNAVPAAVIVSGGTTTCGTGQTITASGGGGGTIYFEGTTANGTSTSTASSSQTVSSSGTYYFRSFSGTCWGPDGNTIVTINTAATAAAGSAQTICAGGTVTLAGSIGGSATSSTWSAPSGSFSNTSSLTSTYTPTITSGTVTLTLTTNDPDGAGPCNPATSTVIITVNPVATASAGSGSTVCAGGTASLSGSIGGSASTSTWSASSGSFSNASSLTSTYTPTITSGNITLTLTTNDPDGAGPCTAATSTTVITVNPAATASAGSPQTVCAGGSVTLAGSIGGSAASSTWSAATGTFSNTSSLTSTYTPSITSGTVTLTLTTDDPDGAGPCTAGTSTVVITVNPVATASAGVSQTVCAGGTATLSGSIGGSASTSTWSASSGSFSNTASLTSTYTPSITSGTVTLTLTTNDPDGAGPCTAATSTTIITVNPAATASAGTPQSVCAGGTVTLGGSIGGSASSSTWSAATGTFSNASSLTSTYTPSIASGTVTLTLTTNDPDGAGPCSSGTSTVVITVNATPGAVTVTPTTGSVFCGSQVITASGGGGGTIYYQGTTSGGTSTATPTTTVNITSNGTYYFRSFSGTCWGSDGNTAITINPAATANAGGAQTVCAGGTVTLAGSIGGSASTGTWSASSGTFSNVNSLTSTYTPSISSGTVTLTLTTDDPDGAGPCSAATSTVVITVNAVATAGAGSPQTVCAGGTVTLSGTIGGSASSSTWSASSGTFSNTASLTSTYTPTISSGTITLTLTTNDPDGAGPCTAANSTVVITVNPAATATAGTPQTVCAGGTVTLAGSIGGSASTSIWTASSGTFSNASSLTSTYTPSISSGTVTLTLTTNDPDGAGPCTSATSTVVITVNAAATTTAGSPQTVCAGGTVTLSGTIGGSATSSTWSATSGTFSNTASLTSTYTPSITSGNITLTLTTNDPDGAGPCTAATSTVVITVDPAATATAGTPQTVCQGGTVTLAGSIGGSATTSTWTASSGTFSNASSLTSTYTPSISSGTVTLTLTTNDPDGAGPCNAATSTVVITVNPAATATAGTPQTVCAGGTVTLAGSIGGSATTSTWSASSGTFSNTALLTSTYTPTITSGTVTLTLTTNDPDGAGPCSAATSTVVITVNPAATANAGTAQTVCQGGTVTLAGSIGGSASTSTWSASSGTFSNALSTTSTYTPSISSGTVTLTLTTDDPDGVGPCSAATSTVVITVNPAATATAGTPQTVCAGGTVTLAGSIGGSATSSTWSASSGTFSNTASLTSTYTPTITSGTVTLTLTTNDPDGAGPCSAATSTVVITVNAAATANAGTPQTVCGGGTITLNGSLGGSATSSTWTAATGTFSNSSSLVSTYTPSISSGTVTLTLTSNDPDGAGPCTAATSTVVVTVNAAATASAGVAQTVCAGGTVTLAGSIGGSAASSTWTASSGTFSNATSLTSTYTPSISSGTVTLTLTTNDPDGAGPCTGAVSTVVITVNPAATDNAGTPQTVCAGGTITLGGSIGGSASTSTWTAASGTFSNISSLASTYTPTIASGNVTLTLTTDDPDGAGPCTAATSTVVITVNPVATDNAGAPQTVCAGGTVTLAGTIGGSATTSTWTASSGTFSNASSLTSTYTPSITSGTVTLTLTTNDPDGVGPCTGAVSTVVITVNPAATATAGTPQTVCAGGTVTLGGSIGGSATTSTWTAPSGTFSNISSLVSTYTPTIASGSVTLTLTTNDPDGAGPCSAATSTVVITVNPVATDNAGAPQTVCAGSSVTLAGTLGGSATTSTWSASSGTFSDVTSLTSTYTPSIPNGTVTLTLTSNDPDGVGPCTAATSTVVITVNPTPGPVNLFPTSGSTFCSNEVVTAFGGTGGTIYYQGTTSGGTSIAVPTTTVNVVSTGTYYFRALTGACWGIEGNTSITIDPPATANAGPAQTVCAGGTITLAGAIGGSASTSTWTASSGTFSNASSLTSTYTPSIASGTVTLTLTTDDPDGAGPCSAAVSTVVITVNPAATDNAGLPQTVCSGGTITLNGNIGGSASTSTWTAPSGTFSNASSLTSTYTPTITSGTITLTLTTNDPDGAGPCSAAISTVAITVNPAATDNAGLPQTVCAGGTVTLGGTIGGSATSSTWSAPSGSFSNTASLTSTYTPSVSSGVVTLTLTSNDPDGAGPCTAAVSTVAITVNPAATANAGAPQAVCAGSSITLAGSIGGSATSSTWSAASGTFSNASSLTSTYTPSIASGTVTLTLTTNDPDGVGPCTAVTSTVVITVNATPTAFAVTGGGSYCAGSPSLHVGLFSSTAGVKYQLFDGPTAVGIPLAGTGSALDFGVQAAAGSYTVFATDTTTTSFCTNTMAGAVAITILPLPTVDTVSAGGAFCAGGTGVDVSLNKSDFSTNYLLYLAGVYTGNTKPGTGGLVDFGLQNVPGDYTVVATSTITLCSNNMADTAKVISNALPTAFNVTGTGSYCSGGAGLHVLLSNSNSGTKYQLFLGVNPVGPALAGIGGTGLDFGAQTAAGTYTVFATDTTLSTMCGQLMNGSAVITIDPLPLVFNMTGGGAYCFGGLGLPVSIDTSQLGVNYQLYLGGVVSGGVTPGTGAAFNFGTETAAGKYTAVATVVATGCTSNMLDTAVIVVNPLPNLFTVGGGGPYCAGGMGSDITLSGSDTGISYQLWNGVAVGSPVLGTGSGILDLGFQTGAGTYTVVGTNIRTGCSQNMTGASAPVVINPLPPLHAISAGAHYCTGGAGVDVNLSTSDAGIGYQLYDGSLPVGGLVAGGAFIDFGFQPAGTYYIVATDLTHTTFCMDTMTGTSVIVADPLPTLYTVGGGGAYCSTGPGRVVTLSGSDTGVSYQLYIGWASTGSPITGTGSALNILLTAGGNYTMIATNVHTGCMDTMLSSATIIVNPLPAAITGATSICQGSTTTLSDATGTGSWTSSATSVATINAISGLVTGVSGGTYNVTYTLPVTGCFVTTADTVNALPVVAPISSMPTLCSAASILFTDATSFGVWSSSNTSVASVDAIGNVTGVVAGTATITYTVTSLKGCVTAVESSLLTVVASPVVTPIFGNVTNICAGLTAMISDTTAGGVWSSLDPTIATVSSTGLVTGVAFGSVDLVYSVTNLSGCTTSVLYGFSIGNPMPAVVSLPLGSATLCHGNPVNLMINTLASGLTYQWLVGGATIVGATDGTYTTSTAGSYVAVVSNGTCQIDLAAINVVTPPMPVITFDSVANLLSTGSFSSYQWYKDSVLIVGDTTENITPTGPGNYTVVVSDGNGCTDTSVLSYTILGTVTTKVKPVVNVADIKVYPNPVSNILYIDAPQKVFVTVMSTDGKMLMAQKEAVSINVGQLANGVYMIMIYDENNMLLKADKFVKMSE